MILSIQAVGTVWAAAQQPKKLVIQNLSLNFQINNDLLW